MRKLVISALLRWQHQMEIEAATLLSFTLDFSHTTFSSSSGRELQTLVTHSFYNGFPPNFVYSTPYMLARCSINHDVQFCEFKNVIFGPPDDVIHLNRTALIIHTCIQVTKKKTCNLV